MFLIFWIILLSISELNGIFAFDYDRLWMNHMDSLWDSNCYELEVILTKVVRTVAEYVEYIESLIGSHNLWFRGVASPKFKPIPSIVWKDANHVEGALEHGFLQSYKTYIDDSNLNKWELYALMQHHGLPTRLLDWSESALVALYFALSSDPTLEGNRAVWVLNPFELNRKSAGDAILYCPAVIDTSKIDKHGVKVNFSAYLPPNSAPEIDDDEYPELPLAIHSTKKIRRVSSQKGCFTVHGSNPNSIDQIFDNYDHFHMIEISISNSNVREKMLHTLERFGIDEEFIFQDLDSLCNRLKRKFKV